METIFFYCPNCDGYFGMLECYVDPEEPDCMECGGPLERDDPE